MRIRSRFAVLLVFLAALAVVPWQRGVAHAAPAPAASHTVTFDGYSFMVDGRRTYLWSGEFHEFRLPSPDLWLDIFQKMKAAGFNATSLYFDWGYHSPAPGVYDFTGVRDIDAELDAAAKAGLYVIARTWYRGRFRSPARRRASTWPRCRAATRRRSRSG